MRLGVVGEKALCNGLFLILFRSNTKFDSASGKLAHCDQVHYSVSL